MGAVLAALGFGGDEGGGDAAVKRQAEGLSNPMYQLANLMGQVRLLESCLFLILLYSRDIIGLFNGYFGKWHYTIEVITTFSVNVATIRAVNQIDRVYFEPAAFFSRYFSRMNPKLACSVWSQLAVYITSNCVI